MCVFLETEERHWQVKKKNHTITTHKKTSETSLREDKIDFKTKNIKDKEGHFIMMEGSIH